MKKIFLIILASSIYVWGNSFSDKIKETIKAKKNIENYSQQIKENSFSNFSNKIKETTEIKEDIENYTQPQQETKENSFAKKIKETTKVEKNIENHSQQINKQVIVDTVLNAHLLSIKNKQSFALSKQKALLTLTPIAKGK